MLSKAEVACVITSINDPNLTSVCHWAKQFGKLYLVTDRKSTDLHMANARNMLDVVVVDEYPDWLPENAYCRKMLGYIRALKDGYRWIFETDDDNYPMNNGKGDWFYEYLMQIDPTHDAPTFTNLKKDWFNQFGYFLDPKQHAGEWAQIAVPRGYPHRYWNQFEVEPLNEGTSYPDGPYVWSWQCQRAPDLWADGHMALESLSGPGLKFVTRPPVRVLPRLGCVFNSQHTLWRVIDANIAKHMYLPTTCHGRLTDILRSYIAVHAGMPIEFRGPCVEQRRNPHDFTADMVAEREMLLHKDLRMSIYNMIMVGLLEETERTSYDKWSGLCEEVFQR